MRSHASLSLIAVVVGASLLGIAFGGYVGWGIGLIAWGLLPSREA